MNNKPQKPQKRERARDALLQRLAGELDGVYDLIFQTFADETQAQEVLAAVLSRATSLSKTERYDCYLQLWILGITVNVIRRFHPQALAERVEKPISALDMLSLEEKLVLFLHDRSHLNYPEIAAVMQLSEGKVGRQLTYAREKVAHEALGQHWDNEESQALRERLLWNSSLENAAVQAPEAYLKAMRGAKSFVQEIPARAFSEIEPGVRMQRFMPFFGQANQPRWRDLSWRVKLGLEASLLGVVGLFAVFVLPWASSRVNTAALIDGRFAEVFQGASMATVQADAITTDRLLASKEGGEGEARETENDEFANMEFPSGDGVEQGSAPLAPSRQAAAVYRLIVQSPSPQELIPNVRELFAQRNVRERESSGRVMPGGVYFDGVTNVGNYPNILHEIQKLGQTKTYSHPGTGHNPLERARVIVWVQQI